MRHLLSKSSLWKLFLCLVVVAILSPKLTSGSPRRGRLSTDLDDDDGPNPPPTNPTDSPDERSKSGALSPKEHKSHKRRPSLSDRVNQDGPPENDPQPGSQGPAPKKGSRGEEDPNPPPTNPTDRPVDLTETGAPHSGGHKSPGKRQGKGKKPKYPNGRPEPWWPPSPEPWSKGDDEGDQDDINPPPFNPEDHSKQSATKSGGHKSPGKRQGKGKKPKYPNGRPEPWWPPSPEPWSKGDDEGDQDDINPPPFNPEDDRSESGVPHKKKHRSSYNEPIYPEIIESGIKFERLDSTVRPLPKGIKNILNEFSDGYAKNLYSRTD